MSDKNCILVGDIGGTNARFALAAETAKGTELSQVQKFKGDEFARFSEALDAYLSRLEFRPEFASLAIAGPVKNGSVALTNRDWAFSETELAAKFGFTKVALINDFTAMARSVPIMAPSDFKTLHKGISTDTSDPIVVAGPGTGFGMAIVVPLNSGIQVIPGEGGHQAFSPQTAQECELMRILQRRHAFVSLELVSSGSGMDAVHEALCERHGISYEKTEPHIIRERAHAGDKVCLELCQIRAAAVMGAMGDIALACGAKGGVVLAGGVSVRIAEFLAQPEALYRFFNRGARSDYMKDIPISILNNDLAPLYGAAANYWD